MIMKRICTVAAAGAALLGAVALANAQQGPEKGREPTVRDKGSDGKELRDPAGARQKPGKETPKATDRPSMERSKGVEGSGMDRPKGAERPDKDRPKGAERPDRDRPKGAERPDKGRPKGAERPDKDRPKGAERPDKDRPKGAGLSEQQRSTLAIKLRQSSVGRTRVRVSVNIGTPVPRSVRLYPLPSAVIVSVPSYRGHSYFVQEDGTIVIVDARTYVVVDVIPVATRAAGLSLSPAQMRFIHATVPKDRRVDIRVRLALGAEIPARVELLRFPAEVRARVPEVEGYRYVVAGRDVVIVDPKDREIALVIGD